jgi:hypothetical protein
MQKATKEEAQQLVDLMAIARTTIALLLHLRFGAQFDIDYAYAQADEFITHLNQDLTNTVAE